MPHPSIEKSSCLAATSGRLPRVALLTTCEVALGPIAGPHELRYGPRHELGDLLANDNQSGWHSAPRGPDPQRYEAGRLSVAQPMNFDLIALGLTIPKRVLPRADRLIQ